MATPSDRTPPPLWTGNSIRMAAMSDIPFRQTGGEVPFPRTDTSGSVGGESTAAPSPISKRRMSSRLSRYDTTRSVEAKQAKRGYPMLARFFARRPGYNIVRRFATLNARNLLYIQYELVDLEHQLNDLENEMERSEEDAKVFHSMSYLQRARPGTLAFRHKELTDQLRHLLREYNQLLLEHHAVSRLPTPSATDVGDLYNFLGGEGCGHHPQWLQHPEDTPWLIDEDDVVTAKDLVSLTPSPIEGDAFTKWVVDKLLTLVFKFVKDKPEKRDPEFGDYHSDDVKVDMITRNVSVVVASLLPTVSIFALYYISTPIWRLIFILIWSGIFSACLAVFTKASRLEVCSASVAMAAVQVVFIGTNGVGGCLGNCAS